MAKFVVQKLHGKHAKKNFACGKTSLDRYLQQFAQQHAKKKISQTYVLTEKDSTEVIGFYSLASTSVMPSIVPRHLAQKLPPGQPLPCALLARLAVDLRHQGKGIGGRLLVSAMKRVLAISEEIGCACIVAEAKDDKTRAFYAHYQLISFLDHENHMFIPMKEVGSIVQS